MRVWREKERGVGKKEEEEKWEEEGKEADRRLCVYMIIHMCVFVCACV